MSTSDQEFNPGWAIIEALARMAEAEYQQADKYARMAESERAAHYPGLAEICRADAAEFRGRADIYGWWATALDTGMICRCVWPKPCADGVREALEARRRSERGEYLPTYPMPWGKLDPEHPWGEPGPGYLRGFVWSGWRPL